MKPGASRFTLVFPNNRIAPQRRRHVHAYGSGVIESPFDRGRSNRAPLVLLGAAFGGFHVVATSAVELVISSP